MLKTTTCLALLALVVTGCSESDDGSLDGGQAVTGAEGGVEPEAGSGGPTPPADFLPAATGNCPGFVDGEGCTSDDTSLICTFSPAGIEPRPVRIWMSDRAREAPAPLVFYWHGLSRHAGDAVQSLAGLGPDVVQSIVDEGGIVASPERSEKRETTSPTELPWLLALGSGEEDDLLVMDEVVACAREQVGIDLRRIHSTGMSAGGLQTGQVTARRSGYLASTVLFSGGQAGTPPKQDPTNTLPVALFHGGEGDVVVIRFMDQAVAYHSRLLEEGHFALLCNHGANHTVPAEVAAAGWQFLKDHPYGVDPSPYADGLPETMPDYCER